MVGDSNQGALFNAAPFHTGPPPGLSVGQRRTLKNLQQLEAGIHPATGASLLADGKCGDCEHATKVSGGNRAYWKCQNHRLGMNRSAASDINVGWPACTLYKNDC